MVVGSGSLYAALNLKPAEALIRNPGRLPAGTELRAGEHPHCEAADYIVTNTE